jgi:hypothetical protein
MEQVTPSTLEFPSKDAPRTTCGYYGYSRVPLILREGKI